MCLSLSTMLCDVEVMQNSYDTASDKLIFFSLAYMKRASHRWFQGFFLHEVRILCVELKFHDAMAQLSTTTHVYFSSGRGGSCRVIKANE